ncbi:GNAT family N-acetyltransferase [Kibdelosporangium phytohabitans]|nr:GNAT family N-acetyltransferase [Kibdelosporangium phytohabitans]MBE1471473.1 GNAT superfamily N-acetyltransferase [Kibdelosporangium phytohabitans]
MLIKRIDITRLDDCLALAVSRDWTPDRRVWTLMFEIGAVFGIDDPGGGLAGCVVSTRYGTRLSAIGMMLVAEGFGRQGLGTRLMEHAIADGGTESTWLTATRFGKPLYEKLGFRSVGECTRYAGDLRLPPSGGSRPVSIEDVPAMVRLDAAVFGAPREHVLRAVLSAADQVRVIEGTDGVRGYGAAWRNVDNTAIGPLVATDERTARDLIADLAAGSDQPIRFHLADTHPELREWLESHGAEREFDTTAMVYGASLPGDRERLFLPLTLATG